MIGFAVVVGRFHRRGHHLADLAGRDFSPTSRSFASLRALGVSMWSLRLIVMELSLWVGVAGLLLTALLTSPGLESYPRLRACPLDFPLFIDVPVAVALLIIAIMSGALSLGVP